MKISLAFLMLSLGASVVAAAPPIPLGLNNNYPTRPTATSKVLNVKAREYPQGLAITQADPGQLIEVGATYLGQQGQIYRPEQLTVLSMTGATLEPGANVYYYTASTGNAAPDPIESIPYSYHQSDPNHGSRELNTPAFLLRIRVGGPDAKGRGVPIKIRARFQGYWQKNVDAVPTGHFPVDETYDFILPVSDAPALEVTPSFTSINQGQLRPDGTATIKYRVTAAGSPIQNLSLLATAPKGTDFTEVLAPIDGVKSGRQILWRAAGPVTSFEATAQIRVKARPGVKTAVAKYSAVGDIADVVTRRKAGSLKMPIKAYTKGTIRYFTGTGENGPVEAGGTYNFNCQDWDPEGGDIFVSLNDVGVTTVPFSNPNGSFTVPPFRDPDLIQILSAYQKGKPSDTEVNGDPEAQVELVLGVAKITDGTTIYRRLRKGDPIAVGEVPPNPDISAGSNRFGLLQIDGPNGAALVRFGGNTRLLYGRDGGVAVYGSLIAGRLKLTSGRAAMAGTFRTQGFDPTAYDPAGTPNLTTITSAQTISTAGDPLEISGNTRAGTLSHSGPIRFNGGLLYVDGNLTIAGDIEGQGAIICTGNFTHRGKLQLTTPNEIVLGVSGSFSTAE